MNNPNPIVELTHITKKFGPVVAVNDVSLNIDPGEFLVLLGPSGSGKTTILSMIGGFTLPTAGTLKIRGQDMTMMPPAARPTVTVFQDYALFPHMSVRDNVAFGLKMRKVGKRERNELARKSLEMVSLGDFGDRGVHQLSGGQRQRVALARAFAVEPAVLLLDEPLGALDLKIRHQMQDELVHLQKRLGATFVHVTHDQEEAMSIADNIALVNGGIIEDYGPPERIYQRPASLFTAKFMGESNTFEGVITSVNEARINISCDIGEVTLPQDDVSKNSKSGDNVHISLRPEQIKLGHGEHENVIRLGSAVIDEVIFQGTHRVCNIICQNEKAVPMIIRLHPDQPVKEKDVIPIHANVDDAVLLVR